MILELRSTTHFKSDMMPFDERDLLLLPIKVRAARNVSG